MSKALKIALIVVGIAILLYAVYFFAKRKNQIKPTQRHVGTRPSSGNEPQPWGPLKNADGSVAI